jgi:hypothetical protein
MSLDEADLSSFVMGLAGVGPPKVRLCLLVTSSITQYILELERFASLDFSNVHDYHSCYFSHSTNHNLLKDWLAFYPL